VPGTDSDAEGVEVRHVSALGERYTWQSIYLTRVIIQDLAALFRYEDFYEAMSQQQPEEQAALDFFRDYLLQNGNKVELIQLNLGAETAGTVGVEAYQFAGSIQLLEAHWDVHLEDISLWLDRYFYTRGRLLELLRKMERKEIDLLAAKKEIENLTNTYLISYSSASALGNAYYELAQSESGELMALQASNLPDYNDITGFLEEYDASPIFAVPLTIVPEWESLEVPTAPFSPELDTILESYEDARTLVDEYLKLHPEEASAVVPLYPELTISRATEDAGAIAVPGVVIMEPAWIDPDWVDPVPFIWDNSTLIPKLDQSTLPVIE
jgi:hypothetical protein